jgi:peptidoglycan/LPS O-acetylase OafA/YrhL
MSAIAYRPEIDGLRAVAVGTVVLFHAGLGIFPGGFIGVDVFFVISGYLITSIIVRELDAGAFSLLSFYERRIRRIFPALLVVIVACLAFGAWRISPRDYDQMAETALAAIGFHSNFYFADKAGYFMPAAETMPLLHTWSLGVEEQFYVVAPLLLMVLWRTKARLVPVVAILFIAALITSVWGTSYDSETAFYLPHTRAVELMIGMVLGLGLVPEVRSPVVRQVLSAAGLLLILLAACLYTSKTPFPGAAALMPCVGSALVIHCAGGPHGASWVGTLLSTSPFVWLGKISYSLYLWHWPVFAFAAYEWSETSSITRVALILLSVILSIITYRYVEQPARTSRRLLTPARVYAAGLGSAAVVASAAAAIAATDGWPGRLPDGLAFVETDATDRGKALRACFAIWKGKAPGPCRIGDLSQPAQVLVWGDSHAQTLAQQFDAIGKELGIGILLHGGGGCPPFISDDRSPQPRRRTCKPLSSQIPDILSAGTIRHVMIGARWAIYARPSTNEVNDRRASNTIPAHLVKELETYFSSALDQTVSYFLNAGLHVTLIGPAPELPVHLPSAMMKARMRGRDFNLSYDFAKFMTRQQFVLGRLADADALPDVDVVYPDRLICPLGKCAFIANGAPLYRDEDHLNLKGGALLRPQLTQSLSWLKNPGALVEEKKKQ